MTLIIRLPANHVALPFGVHMLVGFPYQGGFAWPLWPEWYAENCPFCVPREQVLSDRPIFNRTGELPL